MSHSPKIDIFYKTYPADEEWLTYSIRSVFKYAQGFRQIVVVSNRGHNYTPPSGNIPVKYIEIDLPRDNGQFPHGIGYWWQMAIKLSWDQFTDADAVVVVDSDQIFYDSFSPNSWQRNGKIVWLRRPWSEAGNDATSWKRGAEYLLGKEVHYDYMVCPGFYFARQALQLFTSFMYNRFKQTPGQYYIDLRHPRTSEYVPFGAFLDQIQHPAYSFHHPIEFNWTPWPIKQYWSWGKVKPEIRQEIERFLK